MRICLIADPYLPVPPVTYGGIERVVAMLVDGLGARGHTVTLFAAAGSSADCEVISYGAPPHFSGLSRFRELSQVALGVLSRVHRFDVVHSFGRLAALLPILPASIPKLQSYQRAISRRSIRLGARCSMGSLLFTSCSDALRRGSTLIGRWETVHNGVPADRYDFRVPLEEDPPLVFLGRIEPIKGTHTAIAVARAARRRLVIAGNVAEAYRDYFEAEVRPHIDDDAIRYVGPVDDSQKNQLLGEAAALLMPVEWEEPFGIVMAEALACGTPVIGLARGAVPEVIEHGTNGFVCETAEEMVAAVARIGAVDRGVCRRRFEERFSECAVVGAYERLYFRESESIERRGARIGG